MFRQPSRRAFRQETNAFGQAAIGGQTDNLEDPLPRFYSMQQ